MKTRKGVKALKEPILELAKNVRAKSVRKIVNENPSVAQQIDVFINDEVNEPVQPKKKTKKERNETERDILQCRGLEENKKYLKIVSWNVVSLRSILKNNPDVVTELIQKRSPDILCLQETKLQTVEDEQENFFSKLGYDCFWACSTEKKGYAGTAVFTKKSTILNCVRVEGKQKKTLFDFGIGKCERSQEIANNDIDNDEDSSKVKLLKVTTLFDKNYFHNEGRVITLELESFFVICCYVPNSGQTLDRLDFRVDEWDPAVRTYLKTLEETKPVIFLGDLNVAHLDEDIYNPDAKHIAKQAGLTPRERHSFGLMLGEGFVDAFRYFYPAVRGHYTYWSKRTGARKSNSGLRLDYFVCSESLFSDAADASVAVHDSHILADVADVSDHCPVELILRIA